MSQPLILSRALVEQLLSVREYVDLEAQVFADEAMGRARNLPSFAAPMVGPPPGRFGFKSGYLGERRVFGTKVAASFPENPSRFDLPKIQGTILLWEAEGGQLIAILDGTHITAVRTGAAGAVGARYLARKAPSRVAVLGTGVQGRWQLRAMAAELPITAVRAWSPTPANRERYAAEMEAELGIPVLAVSSPEAAVVDADLIITATWALEPLIRKDWVKPGTFIAAIGADAPGMQELDPDLLTSARVVVDNLEQCREIGEINVPIRMGIYKAEQVHATIGEVAAGLKPGRQSPSEITIFDSTGIGLQDVVVADAVYRKALEQGLGIRVNI